MSAYAAVVGGAGAAEIAQGMAATRHARPQQDRLGQGRQRQRRRSGRHHRRRERSSSFDPYQWTQQYLVPALIKAGYNTEDKQRQALQYLFPNRTAGFIMSQMALQGWKFERDQKLIGRVAPGLSAYDQLIKHDPKMAYAALGAQWDNLKTALGVTLVPVLIPFLRSLTGSLNAMNRFAEDTTRP